MCVCVCMGVHGPMFIPVVDGQSYNFLKISRMRKLASRIHSNPRHLLGMKIVVLKYSQ